MADKITENLINKLGGTVADSFSKQNASSYFDKGTSSVNAGFKRLFGRQKPLHHIFGGGKSADVLLWRNKKISAGVLSGATAIWVLFEWLNYHFLTLVCFALALGLLAQFIWINASGLINRSPTRVARLVIPNDVFVDIGKTVGAELNRGLQFLQDVSCGGNLKQILVVVASLWVAAIVGSWCNFLTVIYTGFVAAHTLPVLYEKHEDEIDDFVYKSVGQIQHHYRKLDTGLLSKIPKGKFKAKKHD